MSNSALDPKEIELRLRNLTPRQCQILYWVGRGLVYKEIAPMMKCGQDLIQKEMSLMYKTLGLTSLRTSEKRRILNTEICPLHQRMVSDPEKDCATGVIDATPPPVVPEDEEEVKRDEAAGLLPLDVGLIRVVQERGLSTMPPTSLSSVPPRKQSIFRRILPWALVVVMAMLLCLAGGAIGMLLYQQGVAKTTPPQVGLSVTPQPPATAAPSVGPTVAAPLPLAPQATYTALPTYTPFPTFTSLPTSRPADTRAAPTATQAPGSGTIVLGGTVIESGGLAVYTSSTVTAWTSVSQRLQVRVRNNRNQDYLLRFTCSAFHLADDTGKIYPSDDSDYIIRDVYQVTVKAGQEVPVGCTHDYLYFKGPVSVQAKYLIFTMDEIAGMTNLRWRFSLQ